MIEKPKQTILVDMDGTIANYTKAMLEGVEALANPDDPPLDIYGENLPLWFKKRMWLIKKQRNWWLNLEPIQSGFDVLAEAVKIGFSPHILTKGPKHTTSAWEEKVLWCQKHLTCDYAITITEDKGLVYGKVLVDDYPDYMLRWLQWRPRGLGVMPCHKSNEGFEHPQVIKYDGSPDSLKRVSEKLQEAYVR